MRCPFRERVDEGALELLLDPFGSVAVVVEQLPLARVEHEAADHEVDTGERHPVGDAVEDRSLADDRERLVRSLDLHRTSFPPPILPGRLVARECVRGDDMNQLRDEAERLLGSPVRRSDLAFEFDESVASSVEVHVEGRNFYPPMLADIAAATSSVHINQFGFRPGVVGERFAEALLAKSREGVPVRLVVDRQGSDPDRSSRAFYERLVGGGVEVRVVRATQLRAPAQPAATERRESGTFASSGTSTIASWSSSTAGSAGSAAPASRITSRTAASTTSSCASPAPSSLSSSSSSWRASRGWAVRSRRTSTRSFPSTRCTRTPYRPPSCTTRRATGRSRPRSADCSRMRARRSTS